MNDFRPSPHFHPGKTLSEKLERDFMTPEEFGETAGIDPETVWDIILGFRTIDRPLAEKLAKATKIPAGFWLGNQKN